MSDITVAPPQGAEYYHAGHDHPLVAGKDFTVNERGIPSFSEGVTSPDKCRYNCGARRVPLKGSALGLDLTENINSNGYKHHKDHPIAKATPGLVIVTAPRTQQAEALAQATKLSDESINSQEQKRGRGRPKGTTGIRHKEGSATGKTPMGRPTGLRPMVYRGQETKYGRHIREAGEALDAITEKIRSEHAAKSAASKPNPAPAKKTAAKKPTTRKSK